jgi:hypothetical protein
MSHTWHCDVCEQEYDYVSPQVRIGICMKNWEYIDTTLCLDCFSKVNMPQATLKSNGVKTWSENDAPSEDNGNPY